VGQEITSPLRGMRFLHQGGFGDLSSYVFSPVARNNLASKGQEKTLHLQKGTGPPQELERAREAGHLSSFLNLQINQRIFVPTTQFLLASPIDLNRPMQAQVRCCLFSCPSVSSFVIC
jgi:hypothetical protein